jgi:hypothetical protein
VNLTGVNGKVIMSGWKDDNPDNERRKTTIGPAESVSKSVEGIAGRAGIPIERRCRRVKRGVSQLGASMKSL